MLRIWVSLSLISGIVEDGLFLCLVLSSHIVVFNNLAFQRHQWIFISWLDFAKLIKIFWFIRYTNMMTSSQNCCFTSVFIVLYILFAFYSFFEFFVDFSDSTPGTPIFPES